tara:strand:+ start:1143 stop:1598 length:456 start_codon:yes stop_codon:yes gene_type:complete
LNVNTYHPNLRANKETKFNLMSFENLYDEVFFISNTSDLTKKSSIHLAFVIDEGDNSYLAKGGKSTLQNLAKALGCGSKDYNIFVLDKTKQKISAEFFIVFGKISKAILPDLSHDKSKVEFTLSLFELDKPENKIHKMKLWNSVKSKFIKI